MAFFREHGYDVTLPDHKRFAQLSEAPLDTSEVDKKELYEEEFDCYVDNSVCVSVCASKL